MPKNNIESSVRDRIEGSRHQLAALFTASFLESTIVPIPLETILIPYLYSHRKRLWTVSAVVLLGCLVGATCGYFIGMWLMDSIGNWVVETFSSGASLETFQTRFEENGFFAVFATGISPLPFQLAMLTAGAAKYSFVLFLVATALSRSIRYFGLALLVHFTGDRAEEIWKKNKILAAVCGLALIALIFLIGQGIGMLID